MYAISMRTNAPIPMNLGVAPTEAIILIIGTQKARIIKTVQISISNNDERN